MRARTDARLPVFAGFALIPMIGYLDLATGSEIGVSLFYLVPVALVTWSGGTRLGGLASLVSAGAWHAADVAGGHGYSHAAIAYWNAAIRLGFFVVTASLLGRLRVLQGRLQASATIDALTGVANARSFREGLELEVARSNRHGRTLSLAYLDLDDFKQVNDAAGHAAGDLALQVVAREGQATLRRGDLLARLGGDEFALLLPETGAEAASTALARMLSAIQEAVRAHGWPMGVSVGLVTAAPPLPPADEIVRAADRLMYAAKREGKGTIRRTSLEPAPAA